MKYYFAIFLIISSITVSWAQQAYIDAFEASNYKLAITSAQEYIKTNPNNMHAYAIMGWSHLSLKQWKQALDIGLIAYKKNNRDPRITQIIGEAYYELNNYNLALEYISRYLRISPNGQLRHWMYYYIANIYKSQAQFYKAEIAYVTALRLDPRKIDWWLELGEVHEMQGLEEEAIKVYREVLSRDSANSNAIEKLDKYHSR